MSPANPVNFFTFNGGLNTEATPLSIKPEELLECVNARIERNGSVSRRGAIDFVEDTGNQRWSETDTFDITAGVNATYPLWDIPANMYMTTVYGSNGKAAKFLFITHGDYIHIFNVDNISAVSDLSNAVPTYYRGMSSSENMLAGYPQMYQMPLNMTSTWHNRLVTQGFSPTTYPTGNHPKYYHTSFCSDRNRVFVINAAMPVVQFTYTNDRWEWEWIRLRERIIDEQETSDSVVYRAKLDYDLDPLADTNDTMVFHVSTCIRSHTSVPPGTVPPAALNEAGSDKYWDFLYTTYTSPSGIDMPRWRKTNPLAGFSSFSTPDSTRDFVYRSSVDFIDESFSYGTTAFGRLWLTGRQQKGNFIYFSQMVVEDDEERRYRWFFSKADPRSQYDAAASDTDGGYININDAVNISSLIPYKNGILAFAENGVWYVSGVGAASFRPTAYSVEKVSDMGVVSQRSVTKYENIIFFFSSSGCYVIEPHEQDPNSLTTKSVSDKILSKYLAIPEQCKKTSLATYNSAEKKLYYWYNDEVYDWMISNNKYGTAGHFRSCLIFDVPLGAWYEYKLTQDNVGTKVSVITSLPLNVGNISSLDEVERVNGEVVTDESANIVEVYSAISTTASISTNLLLLGIPDTDLGTFKLAFGILDSDAKIDFSQEATHEEQYDTNIEFAHVSFNDIFIDKSIPYIQFLFKRTETGVVDGNNVDENEGGALARFIFDWASGTGASPKYGDLRSVYFPDRSTESFFNTTDPNISVVTYRHKLRGRGKSVRIQMVNDGDRPFSLYGYQFLVRGNRGG